MNHIYIREFSDIEGEKFWRNYSLVGDFLNIKKTFWEAYPELPFKDQNKRIIILDNQKYILKIIPKIDVYYSNSTYVSNIGKMIREFIPLDVMNKKIFFTLRGYNEFLKEKMEALNFSNFSIYNLQPQYDLSDIQHFKLWPSLRLDNNNKSLHKSSILANKSDFLLSTLPLSRPIRINNLEPKAIRKSDFENLPNYRKKDYFKLFGKKSNEPINEGRRIPTFINATYITVEFSPFIDNENNYLNDLIKFFKEYEHDSNIYRNDIIDIKHFIQHLINYEILKKRSKIDILVEYIRTHKKHILTLKIIRRLYNYVILTEGHKVDNGLYVIRKNNILSNFIYCLKFDDPTEYWKVSESNGSYISSKNLIKNYNEKNYYYIENGKNFKLLPYLIIKDFKLTTQKSIPQFLNLRIFKRVEKVEKIFKVIYIIKKRYYYSDEVMVDINFQTRTLIGTVRPRGIKIIYFVK